MQKSSYRGGSGLAPHGEAACRVHQLADAAGNVLRVPRRALALHQPELAVTCITAVVFQFAEARHQPLAGAVVHTAQLAAHQGGEQGVHPADHSRRTAEVGIQKQLLGAGLAVFHKPVQLLLKDGGVRLAKAVDALFQIAHKEQIGAVRPGQAVIEGVLQGVGVLVFVHHHLLELLAQLGRQRGGGAVLVLQKLQGQLLHVAEFQHLFLQLGLVKPLVKFPLGPHQRGGGAPVLQKLLLAAQKNRFLQSLEGILQQIPPVLDTGHGLAGMAPHRL